MFRNVLVALDGTPFGEHALPLAVSVARRTGATLNLVHVHGPSIGEGGPIQEELSYLDRVADRVAIHAPEVEVGTALLEGAHASGVAEVLAEHAEKTEADLIVMNSHARGGMNRWWLGNVADDLVHLTAIPLLVTPALDRDPAWQPEPVLRHILIALDGTPLAEEVLPTALSLGNCMKAAYSLLRVVEPAPIPAVDPVCAPAAIDVTAIDRQQASAEAYLARTVARLRASDARLKVSPHVLIDTEPAEAICGFLRQTVARPGDAVVPGIDRPIDLVALATHGRQGLARLLLGSVSDRVLQHAPVPVLLQRPNALAARELVAERST